MQSYTKKRKKGFTLTELAIVIAVIAILIAVLVPTFTSLINKANTSADEQAVKNMNTALSIHEANEDFDTISDVVTALAEDNYDLENYTPLISGMQFYWVKSINRIVYANASSYEVSYPSEYTSLAYSPEDGWYSLNGNIKLDNTWTVTGDDENRTVEISSGAQLASLMDSFSTYSTGTLTIKLTKDVDLMGASYKFGAVASNENTSLNSVGVSGTIEITSASTEPCTIYGFRDDTNAIFGSGEFSGKGYGYGLFANIKSGATVNITNVNFYGMTVEDTSLEETGTLALISGYVYGTLNMTNVKFTNCYVCGQQKVSTIVGQLDGGNVTLKNVDFVDTKVVASYEGAKVVAYIHGDEETNKSFKYDSACDFSGITVAADEDYMLSFSSLSPVGSFVTTYGGYECLFVYHTSGKQKWGNLLTVTTQALYIYTAYYDDADSRAEDISDSNDESKLKTVNYTYAGKTEFILRYTNIPGYAGLTDFSE